MLKVALFVMASVLAAPPSAVTAPAHHSPSGTYTGKLIRLEGKVVALEIRSPHSFLNFEVTDKNGKTTHWAGEWWSPSELKEGGVTKSVLKAGDKIIVEGAAARGPMDHRLLIRSVVRPATGATPEFKWDGRVR